MTKLHKLVQLKCFSVIQKRSVVKKSVDLLYVITGKFRRNLGTMWSSAPQIGVETKSREGWCQLRGCDCSTISDGNQRCRPIGFAIGNRSCGVVL
jgi:hypothetical protein